jgi:hypothetical protein
MKTLVIAIGCLAALTTTATAAAQDRLTEARDLYASAAYADALAALNRVETDASVTTELEGQYRAFCLFALGRSREAEGVVESLVTKNPMLELDGDASPRIAAMFTGIRRRLLPGLVRARYRVARTSMDVKDFKAAEPQLTAVKRLIEESKGLDAPDESTADLELLVDGFLDLIHTSAAAAKVPIPLNVATSLDAGPGAATPQDDLRSANAAAASVTIYRAGSSEVVAPVTVRQNVPEIPAMLMSVMRRGPKTGLLEVIIDEQGNVEHVAMREPIHPLYDHLLMMNAQKWKYRAAEKDGSPVKFMKVVAIAVNLPSVTGSTPR